MLPTDILSRDEFLAIARPELDLSAMTPRQRTCAAREAVKSSGIRQWVHPFNHRTLVYSKSEVMAKWKKAQPLAA